MSAVWNYFKRDKNDKDNASCLICQRSLQCKLSCTSGLKKHLEHIHKIEIPNYKYPKHKAVKRSPRNNCQRSLQCKQTYTPDIKKQHLENNHKIEIPDYHSKPSKIKRSPRNKRIVKNETFTRIQKYEVDVDEDIEQLEDCQQVVYDMEVIGDNHILIQEVTENEGSSFKVQPNMEKPTYIWNYFRKTSVNTAVCMECNVTLMCRDKNLGSLYKHYKTHQSRELTTNQSEEGTNNGNIKDSNWETIAKLFATDNIPIKTLSSSEFFKKAISSFQEIEMIIREFYNQIKHKTISKISEILHSDGNTRFSMILDNSLGLR